MRVRVRLYFIVLERLRLFRHVFLWVACRVFRVELEVGETGDPGSADLVPRVTLIIILIFYSLVVLLMLYDPLIALS